MIIDTSISIAENHIMSISSEVLYHFCSQELKVVVVFVYSTLVFILLVTTKWLSDVLVSFGPNISEFKLQDFIRVWSAMITQCLVLLSIL
ncbi:hypothetical protein RO3G_12288 [Rhizopus delemar RA 99-880]|uniref:Uncharacterized protein n=1 Tax=Rhizopus delemar (strain RA 99-880 / ATCC MYA-4621 / FGSC 9543 / NRRL 43880) TaxID=246409 RepID=I1CGJ7_RHIO9|nr:hypothetical protein RO3G_12288 [Rhizopus delemar RA 99-880]|eukprot:EIE87577.1 hypothetical protein RO3G_12288 [Rhizopus delemar RA 99-880]